MIRRESVRRLKDCGEGVEGRGEGGLMESRKVAAQVHVMSERFERSDGVDEVDG